MIAALFYAFGDLADAKIRRILLLVFVLSLAIAAALIAVVSGVLSAIELVDLGWLDTTIDALGGVAAAFLAWLLFPALALILAYVFAESVAAKIEARRYPGLAPAREESWWRYTKAGIRFEIVTLGLNLLLLPIVLIPFFNVIYPVIFYGVNGYLFGREFLEIVAPRRISFEKTRELRRRNRVKIIVGGVLIALLFTVPVVNLIAPVLATAYMVHLYHGMQGRRPGSRGAGVGEPDAG